jgi:hypothetical protein
MTVGRALVLLMDRAGRGSLSDLRGSALYREHVAASKLLARTLLEELANAGELDGFADLRDALSIADGSPLRGDRDPARRARGDRR